jgi:hypothetical protein
MIIPRERKVVRFYIQLSAAVATKLKENHNPALLVGLLRGILHPYTFASTHIEWSGIYHVSPQIPLPPGVIMRSGSYSQFRLEEEFVVLSQCMIESSLRATPSIRILQRLAKE